MEHPYVGKGGLKLAQAISEFSLDVSGKICIDVGCSTGGFTDCMLQNGAERVYAVDVGYGVLDYKLRIDPRVVVMERFNARALAPEHFEQLATFASADVSFISLKLILGPMRKCLRDDAFAVVLVKPQFEAPREAVPRGGIVTSRDTHRMVLSNALADARIAGFYPQKLSAYIPGGRHNTEFLLLLNASGTELPIDIENAIP